jgi:hypothetical protein
MRLRLPRFRIRTLMVLVGLVAVLLWGAMMLPRSYAYYEQAMALERHYREEVRKARTRPERQLAEFTAAAARKYRRAMYLPFLPGAPALPVRVVVRPLTERELAEFTAAAARRHRRAMYLPFLPGPPLFRMPRW